MARSDPGSLRSDRVWPGSEPLGSELRSLVTDIAREHDSSPGVACAIVRCLNRRERHQLEWYLYKRSRRPRRNPWAWEEAHDTWGVGYMPVQPSNPCSKRGVKSVEFYVPEASDEN